jgi:hypothetical protein
MRSFSLGFAGISHFNDFVGLGVYDNFVFPRELSGAINGTKAELKRADYDLIFGVGMLLGPVFTLYANERVRIPLAAGPHFFMLTASTGPASMLGREFGLGANIGIEYYFTNRIYVLGRVEGTWDFLASTRIYTAYGSASNSGRITGLGVNPNVGIGFKL